MAKRRATRDVDDSDEDVGSPPRRRRLNNHEPDSSSAQGTPPQQSASSGSNLQTMITKLVRLALSAEYSRIPIRRADIGTKVLGENGARKFKDVFDGAQTELQGKFGMQMVELPGRVKQELSITQRRAAHASQKAQAASSKAWTLISTLPAAYKTSTGILRPTRAPSLHQESSYIALYTFLITLILLSPSESLPEAKLERYLKRANADSWTPIGQTDKLLQRLVKEGYLVKARDTSSGEEVVEYSVGPRGKVEVGKDGAKGLIRGMYRGSDVGEDELESKLQRSLGTTDQVNGDNATNPRVVDDTQTQTNGTRRRGRPRRNRGSDDDD